MQTHPNHPITPPGGELSDIEWMRLTKPQKLMHNLWMERPVSDDETYLDLPTRMLRPEEAKGAFMRNMLFAGPGGQPTDEESELALEMAVTPWKFRINPLNYLKKAGPEAYMRIITNIYEIHRRIPESYKQLFKYNQPTLPLENKGNEMTLFIVLAALMGANSDDPSGSARFKRGSQFVETKMTGLQINALPGSTLSFLGIWTQTALQILDGREGVKTWTAKEIHQQQQAANAPKKKAPDAQPESQPGAQPDAQQGEQSDAPLKPGRRKKQEGLRLLPSIQYPPHDIVDLTVPNWEALNIGQEEWNKVRIMSIPEYHAWLVEKKYHVAPKDDGGKFADAISAEYAAQEEQNRKSLREWKLRMMPGIVRGSGTTIATKGHIGRARRIKKRMTHTMSKYAPRLSI